MTLASLATESRNERTENLDLMTVAEILKAMNDEDASIPNAVAANLPAIEQAVDRIVEARRNNGRLIYLGAGTSGRIGLLDAVECPPTFGTDPDEVIGIIAGGENAFVKAVEGAEDNPSLAAEDLDSIALTRNDVVVGLAASGRTPYVIGGLIHARSIGAATIAVSCNLGAEISTHADITIELATGPEVLTGSTRLKAGTATKLVCNMLSTVSMIRTGKVFHNLMVDVRPTNEKLVERARRIVQAATGATYQDADITLGAAGGHAKTAIVMLLNECDHAAAVERLERTNGDVRAALR